MGKLRVRQDSQGLSVVAGRMPCPEKCPSLAHSPAEMPYRFSSMKAVSCGLDSAPTRCPATSPFLNRIRVGMPRMPYFGRGLRVVVHVQFRHLEAVLVHPCEFVEDRRHHPAGAAPFGPEIDQHGVVVGEDVSAEALVADSYDIGAIGAQRNLLVWAGWSGKRAVGQGRDGENCSIGPVPREPAGGVPRRQNGRFQASVPASRV